MGDSEVMQFDPSRHEDLRQHPRYAVDDGVLQVWWLDMAGKMRVTRTRALDISEDGLSLQLPEAVMPLLIRFQSEKFKVKGKGVVRHCRRAARGYVVGLKFSGGLRWHAPAGDIREPIPLCDPQAKKG